LVVATLYTFGLKRGVGADTLSAFCVRRRLQHHLGCSPAALRRVMRGLEQTLVETAHAWECEGAPTGESRAIIGAVDATFLEHLMLVCMDLPSGSVLVEAAAAARTYATWKAVGDERLKTLGATGLSRVSARAKALIQLAEIGFECLSMPDFFPCVHASVKTYARAIGQRLHHAQQALAHAEARLTRRQERGPWCQEIWLDARLVAARRAAVTQWTAV
jgi:hypothetical protein